MATYIAGFFLMLAAAVIMAVGLIFGGKRLRGSCGGSNCQTCSRADGCVKNTEKTTEKTRNEHV